MVWDFDFQNLILGPRILKNTKNRRVWKSTLEIFLPKISQKPKKSKGLEIDLRNFFGAPCSSSPHICAIFQNAFWHFGWGALIKWGNLVLRFGAPETKMYFDFSEILKISTFLIIFGLKILCKNLKNLKKWEIRIPEF